MATFSFSTRFQGIKLFRRQGQGGKLYLHAALGGDFHLNIHVSGSGEGRTWNASVTRSTGGLGTPMDRVFCEIDDGRVTIGSQVYKIVGEIDCPLAGGDPLAPLAPGEKNMPALIIRLDRMIDLAAIARDVPATSGTRLAPAETPAESALPATETAAQEGTVPTVF